MLPTDERTLMMRAARADRRAPLPQTWLDTYEAPEKRVLTELEYGAWRARTRC